MQLYAWTDLRNQISPRLDKFHSIDTTSSYVGVTFWQKPYLYLDYCESKNGYVCQRPAAAGSAKQSNGNSYTGRTQFYETCCF